MGDVMNCTRLLLSSISVLALSQPAFAQDAAEDDGAASAGNVIVVTAQKREQDILEVPVAVSAFSDETLEAANVTDFADITRVSPSLTINGAANNNESTISLRGIGTFSFSTSVEPSVSVVIDDVAVVQQGQAFSNLSDIARIEVLRGPQGTLFGKNASAGVINIVTKAPSDVLTGYVEGVYTTDEEKRISATLSGPLGDTVGFRLNGYYVDRKGYIDNLATGSALNGEEGFGIRGKLVAELGAATITLIGDHSERDVLGNASTFLALPAGTLLFGATPFDSSGVKVGVGADTIRYDTDPVSDNKQNSVIAKIDLDLDFATLSSISSYQDWNYVWGVDLDGTSVPFLVQGGPYDSRQFTQEVRLTSPSSDTFEYIFGLYFADAKTDRGFKRGPVFVANWDSTAQTKSYAAFTQLAYHLGPNTTLSGGARINHEKIGVRFDELAGATPVTYAGSDGDTAFTGKISLQHFVAPDVMAFASFATGYKGQAYDVSSGFNQRRVDNPVEAETSRSYELGLKGRVLDNRMSFSLTGFWTDYNNFQAQSAIIENGAVLVALNNVGKLRTKGVEFEGSFEVSDSFNLFGSAAYTDAKIRSFAGAQCYTGQTAATGCTFDATLGRNVQDLAGSRLANSPKFKFTVGASYDAEISDGIGGFASVNWNWQDDVLYDLFGNPLSQQDAYSIVNLNFGIKEADNESWKVTFFVNNLFDKAYAAGIADNRNFFGGNVVLTQQLARNYSRYGGVRVRFGF